MRGNELRKKTLHARFHGFFDLLFGDEILEKRREIAFDGDVVVGDEHRTANPIFPVKEKCISEPSHLLV